ncbi:MULTISPECIES: tRNA (guanosine(46)-N7)-methyltransferase TrmB [Salimicrobium]|uniref:tRNA (guanine-N(7)-)-methyltransferase n=2 Tax=Salimicrobium TaxID=351195 RepID=A0ABY1L2R3_9BACI|nr:MULTISPECIES: tRNA (guanosine(46)-N7)-methyltransferase TrmB [Salimicrobium]SDX57397.1 tRNA (guanine-N7-)-methyltransferase [Salimicrobium album]SIS95138.1 tRNA (guanine-N(7)-)-methyltransferase [Salimicrobium salexigens]
MRNRNKPWADDFLKENNHILAEEPFSNKGNWQQSFSKNQPLHLEIGAGKGQFIAGMAEKFPEVNFLGIERVKTVMVGAVKKVKTAEVENAVLINEDAKDLRDMFGTDEIDHIYLNFSDPWPKKKHHKRRLTHETFLEQYRDVLKSDGRITLKTDNRSLFEYSLSSFSKFGMTLEDVTLDLHELEDGSNVMTEYEQKFSAKGQPIYRCEVINRI